MERYYIAYGSNLNFRQMSLRCPDAKFVGVGTLDNYELVFRGSKKSAVATVEPCSGKQVPVGIWTISKQDERHLDRYEGFPSFYTKKTLSISHNDKTYPAMIYVMNDGYQYGMPSPSYYQTIKEGYGDCHFEVDILDDAVQSAKEIFEQQEMKKEFPFGYRDVRQ